MIDTHAHIRTKEDIKIAGLKAVVLSASNLEDSVDNLKFARDNQIFYPAVGIHPMDIPQNIDQAIKALDVLLTENPNIVAVGECGLDFSPPGFDQKQQEIAFRGQITLALKHQKPLIIHSRKAINETIKILLSYKKLRGVVHCYSGGKKRIKEIAALGEFYFGIDGNLTYEPGLQEVVAMIPHDRLLLETDCPELTPVPFRNQKNYPEYVKYTYEKTAEIWGLNLEDTGKIIDANARKLFQII